MQSTYKRVIVYDLETGGLKEEFNSITEIAMVAIDLENLEIIDEMSVMFAPRMDLSYMTTDFIKEAKQLYKNLAEKDEELGVKTLKFGEENITLRNLDPLIEAISKFHEFLKKNFSNFIIEKEQIPALLQTDIGKLYFDNTYNPVALEITKISADDLFKEGVAYEDAFNEVDTFIKKHIVGNSKPILAGHNIGSLPRRIVKGKEKGPDGFDNPFMEILFKNNKSDFFSSINEKIIDTLKEARLKWFNLPNFSLGTCANEVGLTLKEAHRALPDTIANAKFLIKMLENLRGVGTEAKVQERKKYKFNY